MKRPGPTRRLAQALLTACCFVAACVEPQPFEPRAGSIAASEDVVPGDGTVAELRARQEAWRVTGPSRYRVEEQFTCFCKLGPELEPTVLEVRDGAVTRAWNLRTGRSFVPRTHALASVERLFELALDWAARGRRVRVSYDRALGYPAMLILGEPEVDAGVTYRLGGLRGF